MGVAAIGAAAIGAAHLRGVTSEWGGPRPAAAGALTNGARTADARQRNHRPQR